MSLLLIASISLYGMYVIHSSEGRALDDLAAGLARQEPDEGAWIPNAHNVDSSVVSFRFELPRFLEWLVLDRDALSSAAPINIPEGEMPRARGLSILGVIGASWRSSQDGEGRYKLETVDSVVDLGMEQE